MDAPQTKYAKTIDGVNIAYYALGLGPTLIVLPAGLGQAPARQAAIGAGIPAGVPSTTLNKMCGSGLKAVMLGSDQIRAGSAQVVLAGGLESMSNAPYLLPKARSGYRMGHGEVLDHMFYDGLQSPWDGKLMGCFADATAARLFDDGERVELVVDVRERRPASARESQPRGGADLLERAVAPVVVENARLFVVAAEMLFIDLGIDVPIHHQQIEPSVVVVIEEPGAETGSRLQQARLAGHLAGQAHPRPLRLPRAGERQRRPARRRPVRPAGAADFSVTVCRDAGPLHDHHVRGVR